MFFSYLDNQYRFYMIQQFYSQEKIHLEIEKARLQQEQQRAQLDKLAVQKAQLELQIMRNKSKRDGTH